MAIFGSKKPDADSKPATPGEPPSSGEVQISPEKAARFFQHARTVDETGNFEYAVQSWLQGLRWEPGSVNGAEGFFASMAKFLGEKGGKATVGKEVARSISGKTEVDRYLSALLEWGQRPTEPVLAVRAVELASKMGLVEATAYIGQRALAIALRDKKPRKDLIIKVAESFSVVGAFDLAVAAAEQALKLDQTDGELAAFIRTLAAQATMNRGGYDQTGQSGGFRANIRDAARQRQLEEAERIVKTEETVDRLISAAENELIKRPDDLPTMERYSKHLLERARPADEEKAHEVLMRAHEISKAFRFRELAGGIRVRQSRRKVVELRKMLDASPGNEMLTRMHSQATEEHLMLEINELKLQVENYPTDLTRKFELGKRYFELGRYQDAIELFQESQSDPKNRSASLNMLGQSFLKIGWNDEGIGALRTALESRDISSELQLEMRYWLMAALQAKAESDRDLESAVEADKIASGIAMQQISYRDIRSRRDAIKKILGELRKPV